jgi:hypothetical protein
LNIAVSGYVFNEPLTAILYDYIGREVRRIALGKAVSTISTGELPAGIYCLKTAGFPAQKVVIGY